MIYWSLHVMSLMQTVEDTQDKLVWQVSYNIHIWDEKSLRLMVAAWGTQIVGMSCRRIMESVDVTQASADTLHTEKRKKTQCVTCLSHISPHNWKKGEDILYSVLVFITFSILYYGQNDCNNKNENKYNLIIINTRIYMRILHSTILLYCTFYNRDKNNEENVLMQKKTKKTEYWLIIVLPRGGNTKIQIKINLIEKINQKYYV